MLLMLCADATPVNRSLTGLSINSEFWGAWFELDIALVSLLIECLMLRPPAAPKETHRDHLNVGYWILWNIVAGYQDDVTCASS